jgi:multidrug resistance efflux pump
MRRRVIIGLVRAVIVIGLIGLFARGLRSSGRASPTPTRASEAALEEPPVTAEGVVVPTVWAQLSFKSSGTLQELAVQEGDTVKGGQLLAQLETADLELAVRGAEENLALNQALLAQAKAGPRSEEVAAAEAGLAAAQAGLKQAQGTLASAQANLNKLLENPTAAQLAAAEAALKAAQDSYQRVLARPDAEDIEQAKLNLDQAKNSLWAAQAERDSICGAASKGMASQAQCDGAKAQVLNAEVAVQLAEVAYQQAQEPAAEADIQNAAAQVERARDEWERLRDGPTAAEVAAAEAQVVQAQGGLEAAQAQVAQAQAQLEQVEAGPRPEDVAVAEVQVRQAKVALEEARLALEKVQLTAPFAGAVVEIGLRKGEMVAPNVPLITLADLSRLQVETTDLDEWGAAKVRVGQRAEITVNAFDDKTLTGTVVAIASQGRELPTGEVAFTVTIALAEQDPDLRWGMTMKVEFQGN